MGSHVGPVVDYGGERHHAGTAQEIETIAETVDRVMADGGWHGLTEIWRETPWCRYGRVGEVLVRMWRGGLLEKDLASRRDSRYRAVTRS